MEERKLMHWVGIFILAYGLLMVIQLAYGGIPHTERVVWVITHLRICIGAAFLVLADMLFLSGLPATLSTAPLRLAIGVFGGTCIEYLDFHQANMRGLNTGWILSQGFFLWGVAGIASHWFRTAKALLHAERNEPSPTQSSAN